MFDFVVLGWNVGGDHGWDVTADGVFFEIFGKFLEPFLVGLGGNGGGG